MAKWAADKKKAKEAQEKASVQAEQEKEILLKTCKYGVLSDNKLWLVVDVISWLDVATQQTIS